MNRNDAALERANDFIERIRPAGLRVFLTEALWLKGRALIALGEDEKALEPLLEARAFAEEANLRRLLWQILVTQAEVAHRKGDPAAASELRTQAGEIVNFIAEHVGSAELRASFHARPDVSRLLAATASR